MLRAVRRGVGMPIGPPSGYATMIALDDAASAVVPALEAPAAVYNVTEDEPVTRAEQAAVIAAALGVSRRLRWAPRWLYSLGGETSRHLLRSQRVSNRRFKAATGWAPAYPSVREGWPAALRS